MGTINEFHTNLRDIAARAVALKDACANEESTKLYLVLPFIGALGYDYTNPREVYPEHNADFSNEYPDKVDFAIFIGGVPSIAIEVKKVGSPLLDNRGQLARYFNSIQTVRVGIITNGLTYAFYVDSDAPNMMDEEPFLFVDLENLSAGTVDQETLDAIHDLSKPIFNPNAISEQAQMKLLKKRLRSYFRKEARSPSQDFCRLALESAGLKYLRAGTIERQYAPIVASAFEESLIAPVVAALRAPKSEIDNSDLKTTRPRSRIVTTERELSIYAFTKRRLSFLVSGEALFDAVERIKYKDYIGHFVVFYEQIKKGRIFDFSEGANGYDKYTFPDPYGEIITSNLRDLDEALLHTFMMRVQELGGERKTNAPSTRSLSIANL